MIHLTRAARSLALAALIGLPVAGGAAANRSPVPISPGSTR